MTGQSWCVYKSFSGILQSTPWYESITLYSPWKVDLRESGNLCVFVFWAAFVSVSFPQLLCLSMPSPMRLKRQQMLLQGWEQCGERMLSIYRNLYGLTDMIPLVFTTHWVYCWRHKVIYWQHFLLISFFLCHRKLPRCFQSCLTEITLFPLCILFPIHFIM